MPQLFGANRRAVLGNRNKNAVGRCRDRLRILAHVWRQRKDVGVIFRGPAGGDKICRNLRNNKTKENEHEHSK